MKTLRLTKRERAALKEYLETLVTLLPDKIDSIFLFGSKTRLEAKPSSDTDVAVLLRGEKSPTLRYSVVAPTFEPIAKYRVDISPILVSRSAFREDSPFIRRLKREGITLWSHKRSTSFAV